MLTISKKSPIRIHIKWLIEAWKYRVSIDKDAHVAISGDEGEGKSNLMLLFLKEEGYKTKEDIYNHIVFTDNADEYFDKYEHLEKGEILAFDEALGLINRQKWYEKDIQEIVEKVRGHVRKEKNPIFLYNVQLFRDLHPYWRNHRIRYWIELAPREWFKQNTTWAFVLKRQRVPFTSGKRDNWLLEEVEKAWLKKMNKGALIGKDYLNMLRSHPFYVGEFKVPYVGDLMYKRYLKAREEALEEYKKKEVLADVKESKKVLDLQIKLGKILALLNNGVNKEKYSMQELGDFLEMSPNTISKYIKLYYAHQMIEQQ